MIFTGVVGAVISLISVIWVGWNQFSKYMCLTVMCVRGLSILVVFFIFLAKSNSQSQMISE